MKDEDLQIFLRMMSKRGFYEILKFAQKKSTIRYNQTEKYGLSSNIVSSQASVTIILNGLTNLGLLTRTVVDEKPPSTEYQVSKAGKYVLKTFVPAKISLITHNF